MKTFIKFIAVLAILYTVPKVVTNVMGVNKTSSSEKEVASEVSKLNATLPRKLDQVVTLTRAEFANNIFSNYYSLSGDIQFGQAQKQIAQQNAINQVCLGPMKKWSDNGVVFDFHYEYTDAGQPKTFDISVPPSKCPAFTPVS